MSTKTMRLPPRRVESNNKRKEREEDKSSSVLPIAPLPKQAKFKPGQTGSDPVPPKNSKNNTLLAGYLAHEFLTKGSVFGHPFDPVRSTSSNTSEAAEPKEDKNQRYAEVTRLLVRKDGAHLPGIVNPTQLARFLHL